LSDKSYFTSPYRVNPPIYLSEIRLAQSKLRLLRCQADRLRAGDPDWNELLLDLAQTMDWLRHLHPRSGIPWDELTLRDERKLAA